MCLHRIWGAFFPKTILRLCRLHMSSQQIGIGGEKNLIFLGVKKKFLWSFARNDHIWVACPGFREKSWAGLGDDNSGADTQPVLISYSGRFEFFSGVNTDTPICFLGLSCASVVRCHRLGTSQNNTEAPSGRNGLVECNGEFCRGNER